MTARLIVMDIDSTLINQEVIDLLGEEAGVGEQVAQITERAMRGELDFKQALEERVGLLAGLDESVFERTFERVTFTPGALELVRSAHSKGWKVGVVSGGFHEVADKIVAAAGIDFCLANRLEVVDGKLTDHYVSPVVMSGYVPDLLKSISMISDDFRVIGMGSCGKGYKEWVRVSDGGPALKARVKLA